jgi:hypothetical protein
VKIAGFRAEASLYRSAARFGRLRASRPGGSGVALCQDYFPNGTYQQSCRDCSYYNFDWINGGVNLGNPQLVCTCLNEQAAWVTSSLDVDSCNADIANCNGQLTCGGC